ncbi:ABC transporter permease [Natrinema thermotolerans]|uniref:ABC transporter permease n=1 Tax=Natrinema thermotolerans TaxID=121872 RepID=A0AAF0T418_9EURY|nr:ABC transporter permease subunit [Natrinema thermotolerans]QCC58789.1 ABC transporter permease [Natrinema thermotolerans]WMT09947.1 ABC transporter permease [Natrinema thermotolerans]
MSTLTVAKKEFRDAVRSKELWLLMGLFVLFLPVVALYDVTADTNVEGGLPPAIVFSAVFVMTVLIPVTALLVSIKSIVRERSHGTIKFLLACPHTRTEVYAGKLLGRLAVFTAAILVGYLPALVILAVGIPGFAVVQFLGVLVVMVCFGFIFLNIGLCASALTKSESRASVAGFAIFFLVYSWQGIFSAINDAFGLLEGHAATFVARFQLGTVSEDIANAVASLWNDDVTSASTAVSGGGEVPFYLQHWFAFVLLAVWIGGPIALGCWNFNRAEL